MLRFHLFAHQRSIFGCHLEVGFPSHVTSRTALEQETKVDMNDVTVFVNQDISVMAIFDLKNKGDQTVGSHASNEISASFDVLWRFHVAVSGNEVLQKTVRLLAKLIPRFGIWYTLDNSATRTCGYNAVRIQIQLKSGLKNRKRNNVINSSARSGIKRLNSVI